VLLSAIKSQVYQRFVVSEMPKVGYRTGQLLITRRFLYEMTHLLRAVTDVQLQQSKISMRDCWTCYPLSGASRVTASHSKRRSALLSFRPAGEIFSSINPFTWARFFRIQRELLECLCRSKIRRSKYAVLFLILLCTCTNSCSDEPGLSLARRERPGAGKLLERLDDLGVDS
jgi:hypothetical protein